VDNADNVGGGWETSEGSKWTYSKMSTLSSETERGAAWC
jgi:hypothetical protein